MGDEEKKALMSVIDSGWFTEAAKTKEFEKIFAKFVGSKYACVVTSGTAGLYMSLKALGIGKGDEVIVPDLTFVASPNSIEATGAKPVLIDVENKSLNLDLEKLDKTITKKTKAIMPVNFNGRSTNMKLLHEIAEKNSLMLIEDAAHSLGSYFDKKHQGTLGEFGVFSFSTPKIITTGQGGMIVTNNKKLFERCMQLKDFGRNVGVKKNMIKAFEHTTIGYNFKFTEFQAAIGLAQMQKLPARINIKKKIFKKYRDELSTIKEFEFLDTDLMKTTPWMVDIILKSKSRKYKLIYYLKKKKIETRIFYPPIHRLSPYKNSDNKFNISSDISDRGLWLPSSVILSNKDLEIVCDQIKHFFKYKLW